MAKETVIDVAARRQASAALRGFMEGRLSNAELDKRYPGESADIAVHVIYCQTWRYQDDLHEYRLERTAISPEEWALLQRCALFLESDLPYEWPSIVERALLWLRSLSLVRESAPGIPEKGEPKVWPFYREQDWKRAAESTATEA